jgi:CheY-like chemotaxis protein
MKIDMPFEDAVRLILRAGPMPKDSKERPNRPKKKASQALEISSGGIQRLDALLTDVIMPEMNGYELAKQVRATQPMTRVLYMSGYTGHAIRERDPSVEGSVLIEKPFTRTMLLRRMREVLAS